MPSSSSEFLYRSANLFGVEEATLDVVLLPKKIDLEGVDRGGDTNAIAGAKTLMSINKNINTDPRIVDEWCIA